MIALVLDNAINGNVHINEDGSFYYSPNIEFSGIDEFSYVIFDGYSLSAPANVLLDVDNTANIDDNLFTQKENMLTIFPNPATDFVNIKSNEVINNLSIFDSNGRRIIEKHIHDFNYSLKLSSLNQGVYFLKIDLEDETLVKKITIHR
jgi:endo-1,4-beta-xylanase